MVSPLFIEVFGLIIVSMFAKMGLFYFSSFRMKIMEENRNLYFKALENSGDKEYVYKLGHLYYSLDYPDKINLLDFLLDGFDSSSHKEKRQHLIINDLKGRELAA